MKKVQFSITDAGRDGAGFAHERNDCTVRALATAGNMSYADAHHIMWCTGRHEGGLAHTNVGLAAARYAGKLEYEPVEIPEPRFREVDSLRAGYFRTSKRRYDPTLAAILPLLSPDERYVIRTRNHAFAVVNGKIHDSRIPSLHWRIRNVWRVMPKNSLDNAQSL